MNRQEVSKAISELMPAIIRGVHLDFFTTHSITQTQFLLLIAIHSYGQATMSLLAKSMHVRMPTATGMVDRLVRDGLVTRSANAEDRRQVTIALTEKGRAFIKEFQKVIRTRWEEVLKSVGPSELKAFYHVILKLREQLTKGENLEEAS